MWNRVFGTAEIGNTDAVRTLAIGDIHGCLDSLKTVVAAAGVTAADRLVLLGDYVDRGPDVRGVIDWILETQRTMEVITLRGNHEELMMVSRTNMERAHFWAEVGGVETLASYKTDYTQDWQLAVPPSHWQFLEQTELYFETEKAIFVHGMVDDQRSLPEQDSSLLMWTRCYEMKPHRSGRRVVCGHTAHKDGEIGVYEFGACIDTAACKGQWLTCLDADTGEYWQANEAGNTRTGRIWNE